MVNSNKSEHSNKTGHSNKSEQKKLDTIRKRLDIFGDNPNYNNLRRLYIAELDLMFDEFNIDKRKVKLNFRRADSKHEEDAGVDGLYKTLRKGKVTFNFTLDFDKASQVAKRIYHGFRDDLLFHTLNTVAHETKHAQKLLEYTDVLSQKQNRTLDYSLLAEFFDVGFRSMPTKTGVDGNDEYMRYHESDLTEIIANRAALKVVEKYRPILYPFYKTLDLGVEIKFPDGSRFGSDIRNSYSSKPFKNAHIAPNYQMYAIINSTKNYVEIANIKLLENSPLAMIFDKDGRHKPYQQLISERDAWLKETFDEGNPIVKVDDVELPKSEAILNVYEAIVRQDPILQFQRFAHEYLRDVSAETVPNRAERLKIFDEFMRQNKKLATFSNLMRDYCIENISPNIYPAKKPIYELLNKLKSDITPVAAKGENARSDIKFKLAGMRSAINAQKADSPKPASDRLFR
ncbi:MAG: hypothetical protein LBM38_05870 [Clostridiales bacterium]|nr:hypothetical protein [Clostridiales bacterium]